MQPQHVINRQRRLCVVLGVSLAWAQLPITALAQSPSASPPAAAPSQTSPAVEPALPLPNSLHWFREQGMAAIDKGDYKGAIALLERALKELEPLTPVDRGMLLTLLAIPHARLADYESQFVYQQQALQIWQSEKLLHQEVGALIGLGQAHLALHRPAKALECFQQGLAIQRGLPADKPSEAMLLQCAAMTFDSLGRRDDSLQTYKEAVQAYQAANKPLDAAECWQRIADIHNQTGKHKEALAACRECEQIVQKLPDNEATAPAWSKLGSFYSEQGLYNEAVALEKRALVILEKRPELLQASGTVLTASHIYAFHGDYEQAIAILKQHLAALDQVSGASNLEERRALIWSTLGSIADRMCDYDSALDAYQKCEAIYSRLKMPTEALSAKISVGKACAEKGDYSHAFRCLEEVSDALRQAPPNVNIAYLEPSLLMSISRVYWTLGQYERGMDYQKRAYELAEAGGHVKQQAFQGISLAFDYMSVQNFPEAVRLCEKSISLLQPLGNKDNIAEGFGALGSVYMGWGQARSDDRKLFEQGAGYARQTLDYATQSGNLHAIARHRNALGLALLLLEKPAQAIPFLNDARHQGEQIHNVESVYTSLKLLNIAYRQMGDYKQTLIFANLAMQNAQQRHDQSDIAACYTEYAKLYQKQGRLDLAEEFLQEACALLEKLSEQVGDASQIGAFEQRHQGNLYAWQAQVKVGRKQEGAALAIAERGRTQGLALQAAQSQAGLRRSLTPLEVKQLTEAVAERTRTFRLQEAVRNARPENPAAHKEWEQRVHEAQARSDEAERRLTARRDRLFATHPEFRRVQGRQPPTFADLQNLARRNPDTLYLEYVSVDNKTTLLFALSQQAGLKVVTLPVGKARLAGMVKAWRDDIQCVSQEYLLMHPAASQRKEPGAAQALYGALLGNKEISALLAASWCKRLVVVPDGPLLEAPFAALMAADGKRLVERLPISVSFSLGLLTWPAQKAAPAENGLLCVADPAGTLLGSEVTQASSHIATRSAPKSTSVPTWESLTRGRFGRLPGTRVEAKKVGEQQGRMMLLIGPQANEAEVKRLLPRYALLHFATHGSYEAHNGMRSFLVLAPEPKDSAEDGYLEARELVELPLSAQMAVLSACETAQGEPSGGEGLLGLVWALRAAGCPSVIASHWQVNDATTSRLMPAFYRHLRAGERKDEALRSAILETQKIAARPYDWAAFSVYGETNALPSSLFAHR